jgi:hypothetical protein
MTPYKKPKLNQKRNLGVCWERAEYDLGDGRVNPEKAFQEAWDKQNTPNYTSRFGTGQDIFIVSKNSADNFDGPTRDDISYGSLYGTEICVYKLSVREHRILATFVQWLGTNCGFGFLHEALQRCGRYIDYHRTYIERKSGKLNRYEILKADHEKAEKLKAQPQIEPDPIRDGGRKNVAPMQTELSFIPELCVKCPHSDGCDENKKPGSEHCFKVLHHLA